MTRAIWHGRKDADLYGAEALHLMNLETGMKMDIPADYGGYVRLFGFVENDMIYGKAEQEDQWIEGEGYRIFQFSTCRL